MLRFYPHKVARGDVGVNVHQMETHTHICAGSGWSFTPTPAPPACDQYHHHHHHRHVRLSVKREESEASSAAGTHPLLKRVFLDKILRVEVVRALDSLARLVEDDDITGASHEGR